MNETLEDQRSVAAPAPRAKATPKPPVVALAAGSPAATMLAALSQGASLDQIEKMMDLQARWEAGEAKKAYDQAFASFKAETVRVQKTRTVENGPLKGNRYAELSSIINAVTPALSKHGLSSSWKLTRDEKDWLEVTCYLRHVGGHEESVSMGGPPDVGGAKNAIQARASTKSYLERYTLKAILGISEQGDDDDGNGGLDANETRDEWIGKVEAAKTSSELDKIWSAGCDAIGKTNDLAAFAAFKRAVAEQRKSLKGA